MKNLVSRFVKDESGATAIEYGLIAAGIAIAIITAVNGLGTKLSTNFNYDLDLAEVSDGSTRLQRPRLAGAFFVLRSGLQSACRTDSRAGVRRGFRDIFRLFTSRG